MQELKERVEDSTIDDSQYNVIMFNDDVTPFDYVILVLNSVFNYDVEEGLGIALHIHHNGKAIVATMSMNAAYEKVEAVDAMNEHFGMLLQTNVEKA